MGRDQEHNDRTQVQLHDPLVGQVFNRRFHIDFRIAVGGFGAIYHATHKSSGHQFALKILHPRLANDPGVVARFRREGETLTRLRDPHTIIAYEVGEADDGTLFIVLELLHGESLFERYRARGPIEWKQMVAIARGVCRSLEEAHGLGIIHRDLKPTNINLERKDGNDSFAKVLDFGIAKILRESDIDSSDLTNAGQMIGTLDYMAPEQMVGGACTAQTDIYTLGIVMYEMIAGRRPFPEANSPAAVLAAMLRTTPDPLSGQKPVPAPLDKLVMRCLEREPTRRWPDVATLGAALDKLLRGDSEADEHEDVTRTLAIESGEESTMLEERPRPLFTAPYPAQIVRPSEPTIGEAPTEPAPPPGRQRTIPQAPPPSPPPPRGSHPLLTTLQGRPAPPPTTPPPLFNVSHPTPVTVVRKPPTAPPPAGGRPSQPAMPPHGGGLATPLPNSGLALFPPPGPANRKQPTAPPPMAVISPPGPPQPLPLADRPVMNLSSFAGPSGIPPTPLVQPLPPGPGMPGFDMSQIAARDAAVRRIVWIVVLVIAVVIGVVLATQL